VLDGGVGFRDTHRVVDDALPDIPVPPDLFPSSPPSGASGCPVGAPAPGAVTAALGAAMTAELLSGDAARIEAQVLEILAAAQHRPVTALLAEDAAQDGSPVLDSMDAVFVIQIVEQALDGSALTLRNNSEPDDFGSVRALARLLQRLLGARRVSA